MSDLPSLKTKLEQADGPSRELDADIYEALCFAVRRAAPYKGAHAWAILEGSRWRPMAHPTSSLDAALTLVERMLPGWRWEVRSVGTAILHQMEDYDGINDVVEVAPTPALALLLALVTALIAQGETNV